MNIIELTENAIEQFATYRNPDIDKWVEIIDPILKAAGELTIGRDSVEYIRMSDDMLYIETSYTCRGCSNSNEMKLPRHILESDDPMKAANVHRIEKKLADVEYSIGNKNKEVSWLEQQLEKLQKEYREYQESLAQQ